MGGINQSEICLWGFLGGWWVPGVNGVRGLVGEKVICFCVTFRGCECKYRFRISHESLVKPLEHSTHWPPSHPHPLNDCNDVTVQQRGPMPRGTPDDPSLGGHWYSSEGKKLTFSKLTLVMRCHALVIE